MPEMHFWPIFSGSSGNVLYAAYGSTRILIDAGVSATGIESALKKADIDIGGIDAVLVTHEHSDHVSGLPVLSRKHGIPVYANRPAWDGMEARAPGIPEKNKRVFNTGEAFHIKDMLITPFLLPHDSAEPVGFSISAGGMNLCVITDLGHVPKRVLGFAKDADIVLLESNHDVDMLMEGSYPQYLKTRILSDKGHLSNVSAASSAADLAKAGVKGIVLGHISRDNNREEKAFSEAAGALARIGATPRDIFLGLAYRDGYGSFYRIR